MIYTCTIDTRLGEMTAAAENEALIGLWFIGQKYYPTKAETWVNAPEHSVFKILQLWLEDYFLGNHYVPQLKLKPKGTPFQIVVWKLLLEIPLGQITTYGEIANKVAAMNGLTTMSAQAVGGAVGHNPISILIPCHRVVGANKKLTGYAGGLDKKKALLELEYKK